MEFHAKYIAASPEGNFFNEATSEVGVKRKKTEIKVIKRSKKGQANDIRMGTNKQIRSSFKDEKKGAKRVNDERKLIQQQKK